VTSTKVRGHHNLHEHQNHSAGHSHNLVEASSNVNNVCNGDIVNNIVGNGRSLV